MRSGVYLGDWLLVASVAGVVRGDGVGDFLPGKVGGVAELFRLCIITIFF
jgi:hypothetical protein